LEPSPGYHFLNPPLFFLQPQRYPSFNNESGVSSSFIVSQLSRLRETTLHSRSHGGCKTRSAELVRDGRGRQPPPNYRVVRLRLEATKVFPQLFEGWSRVDPGLCHPVQHFIVWESRKACSPTYGPTPLSNHRQRLNCPLFTRLQRSDPKRFVRGGRFCAASCWP
jgi:hypothetical protein